MKKILLALAAVQLFLAPRCFAATTDIHSFIEFSVNYGFRLAQSYEGSEKVPTMTGYFVPYSADDGLSFTYDSVSVHVNEETYDVARVEVPITSSHKGEPSSLNDEYAMYGVAMVAALEFDSWDDTSINLQNKYFHTSSSVIEKASDLYSELLQLIDDDVIDTLLYNPNTDYYLYSGNYDYYAHHTYSEKLEFSSIELVAMPRK